MSWVLRGLPAACCGFDQAPGWQAESYLLLLKNWRGSKANRNLKIAQCAFLGAKACFWRPRIPCDPVLSLLQRRCPARLSLLLTPVVPRWPDPSCPPTALLPSEPCPLLPSGQYLLICPPGSRSLQLPAPADVWAPSGPPQHCSRLLTVDLLGPDDGTGVQQVSGVQNVPPWVAVASWKCHVGKVLSCCGLACGPLGRSSLGSISGPPPG